jgi:hypothetical protein
MRTATAWLRVCGYFSIVNGWALALGLELNPHAASIWNMEPTEDANLYQVILELTYYVRIGVADWRLIYAFLRCHRLVHEGEVPHDRCFTRTVALSDESDGFSNAVRTQRFHEIAHWKTRMGDLDNIKGRNRINLPLGRPHTKAFVEDKWNKEQRTRAGELSESGFSRASMSGKTIDSYCDYCVLNINVIDGRAMGKNRSGVFFSALRRQSKQVEQLNRDQLLSLYRYFLDKKATEEQTLKFLRDRPCVLAADGRGLYEKLFEGGLSAQLENALPTKLVRYLENRMVNLAIAVVVEAIDQRQHQLHLYKGTTPFDGGFALSRSIDVTIARGEADDEFIRPEAVVSRPRRCWLLPFTYNELDVHNFNLAQKKQDLVWDGEKAQKGHTLLTVVQEQQRDPTETDPRTTEFAIYTYDSSNHMLDKVGIPRYIVQCIKKTAKKLQGPHNAIM